MKDATLNIKLSKQLYDAIKAEAVKNEVSMAAYVRAVMARQVFGKQTKKVGEDENLLIDKNNAFIFEL